MDMRTACAYQLDMAKKLEKLRMSPKKPFDPGKPYNSLPLVPSAQVLETPAVLRKCIAAGRALAALQQAAHLIPNQDILINSIPLREAKDSSAIENILTTNDNLFRHANVDPDSADDATKETLRYRTALMQGFKDIQTRPLSTRTAVTICRTIKNIDIDIRTGSGTALIHQPSGKVIYTPPEGETILRDKLSALERFLHAQDGIDPLIRMAAAHYQFEAIHPFIDGNGRTGRILNTLVLIENGLLSLPILYLSRYIQEHRTGYHERLLAVTTHGAWEPWLLFMLSAVKETSIWTTGKIHAIRELMDATVTHVKTASPKIYSQELVEIIFVQPYSRIGDLVAAGLANRVTASKYLKELALKGVLEERKEGRENLFINIRLLDLLVTDENRFKPFA